MKQLMPLFALALTTTGTCAATNVTAADTIVKVACPDSVVITETDSMSQVSIYGRPDDHSYTFNYIRGTGSGTTTVVQEHVSAWDFILPFQKKRTAGNYRKYNTNFNIGFVSTPTAPADMDIDVASSVEVGFQPLSWRKTSRTGRTYWTMGLSFDWRNYRLTNRTRFAKGDNENLVITAYPEQTSRTYSSRIKVFSLGIPVRFGINMSHNWTAEIGANLNFNTHASIKSRYKLTYINDNTGESTTRKVKDYDSNIHQQKVTVDFIAQVYWRSLGFYCKYSPVYVLNTDYGPKFTPLSFGLSLRF